MGHKNLVLSIMSGLTSVGNFCLAAVTKNNIAWAVGLIAGLYSIYCSYLTHKSLKKQK